MGIKETLIRLSEMPSESLISISGNNVLHAENCCCVTAYDDDLAVLRMKDFDLRVIGTALVLENYGAYGVKLTGNIHSLTFEERAEVQHG